MQNAGQQYGQGGASSHQTAPFGGHSETTTTGGSITSSLRQFRRKNEDKQSNCDTNTTTTAPESHVARVAPHSHYPPRSTAECYVNKYPQYPDYGLQQPVKYSEISEPHSSIQEHISPTVIQKAKSKEYMDMCNVQQQHMKPTYDHLNGQQTYHEANIHPHAQYHHKEPQVHHGYKPESQYYSKDPQYSPQHPHQMPKYNIPPTQVRKYPAENDFLSKLRRIHPTMARSIMSDHHLQESQTSYQTMDQNRMYPPQNHRYFNYSSGIQSSGYNSSGYMPSYPNYPNSCSYNRPAQMTPRFPPVNHHERSISPQRRGYPDNMGMPMNYGGIPPQKISPNYHPQYNTPEYAQHYQHRRAPMTQEYYPPPCRPTQYLPHQIPSQDIPENRVTVSDNIKHYIENWADEETASEISQLEGNRLCKEGMRGREDQSTETVYMINASDLYLENEIPLVSAENGVPVVTNESGQYVIKGGVSIVNGSEMVRIVEKTGQVEIDTNGERVVNLHIMDTPKSDCMLASKPNHPNQRQTNESTYPVPEKPRVVVHQNTVISSGVTNPVIPIVPPEPQQDIRVGTSLPILTDSIDEELIQDCRKETADKNCSPINLDQLEHFRDQEQSSSFKNQENSLVDEIASIQEMSSSPKNMTFMDTHLNNDHTKTEHEVIQTAQDIDNPHEHIDTLIDNAVNTSDVMHDHNSSSIVDDFPLIESKEDISSIVEKKEVFDSSTAQLNDISNEGNIAALQIKSDNSEDQSINQIKKEVVESAAQVIVINTETDDVKKENIDDSAKPESDDQESDENKTNIDDTEVAKINNEEMKPKEEVNGAEDISNDENREVIETSHNNSTNADEEKGTEAETSITLEKNFKRKKRIFSVDDIINNIGKKNSDNSVLTRRYSLQYTKEFLEKEISNTFKFDLNMVTDLKASEININNANHTNEEKSCDTVLEKTVKTEEVLAGPVQNDDPPKSPVCAENQNVAMEVVNDECINEEPVKTTKIESLSNSTTVNTENVSNSEDTENIKYPIDDKQQDGINSTTQNNNENEEAPQAKLNSPKRVSNVEKENKDNGTIDVETKSNENNKVENTSVENETVDIINTNNDSDKEPTKGDERIDSNNSDSIESKTVNDSKESHSNTTTDNSLNLEENRSVENNPITNSINAEKSVVLTSEKKKPTTVDLNETTSQNTRDSSAVEPSELHYRNVIRVEETSVLLEIAGELVEINVNKVNGKNIITVVPVSDTSVVDLNDNYESFDNSEAVDPLKLDELPQEQENSEIVDFVVQEAVETTSEIIIGMDLSLEEEIKLDVDQAPVLCTKAAKKAYDCDLQIPSITTSGDILDNSKCEVYQANDKVSSTKISKPKKLKKKVSHPDSSKSQDLPKRLATKPDRKSIFKELIAARHKKQVKIDSQKAEDDDFVPFKDLIRARKLKKLQKIKADDSTVDSTIKIDETQRPEATDTDKNENVEKKIDDNPQISKENNSCEAKNDPSDSINKTTHTTKDKIVKRVSFNDISQEIEANNSKIITDTVTNENSKIETNSAPENVKDNKPNGASKSLQSKKRLSLEEYNKRKRKPPENKNTEDIDAKKPKIEKHHSTIEIGDSFEKIKPYRTKSVDDIITLKTNSTNKRKMSIEYSPVKQNNLDWEETQSPKININQNRDHDNKFSEFKGLINDNKTNKSKVVIDLNDFSTKPTADTSEDEILQNYKEQVDSKLSSLNIRIPTPKSLERQIVDPFSKPETNVLIDRFLKNDKLNAEEMEKIRKIISYKRLVQQLKKTKSPNANVPPTFLQTFETRREILEKPPKSVVKRPDKKKNRFRNLYTQIDTDSETDARDRKCVDYSVVQSNCLAGVIPKLIIKRKTDMPLPIVRLERLDPGIVEEKNRKYAV